MNVEGKSPLDESSLGVLVHAVPLFEPDPLHPGRMRIKRDANKQMVLDPAGVAKYEHWQKVRSERQSSLGPAVTNDPVHIYYEKELFFQTHPELKRPLKGAWAERQEIPEKYLLLLAMNSVVPEGESAPAGRKPEAPKVPKTKRKKPGPKARAKAKLAADVAGVSINGVHRPPPSDDELE